MLSQQVNDTEDQKSKAGLLRATGLMPEEAGRKLFHFNHSYPKLTSEYWSVRISSLNKILSWLWKA